MKRQIAIFTIVLLSALFLSGLQTKPQYYVGSSQSNKYHLVECKWAKKISPKNLVKFKTVAEVKKAGYVPCKVCKPPTKD
jgi:methylphosphotriester-DNA--protein-cysteine methyltransferase